MPRLLVFRATLPFAALASILVFAPGIVAQPTEPIDLPLCVGCISPTTCVTHGTGLGGSECRTGPEGCMVKLGPCGLSLDQIERDLRLPADRIEHVRTADGELALAPVSESLWASWDCLGRLVYVAERNSAGEWVPLPVERYRERFAYERVRENAAPRG